MKIKSIEKITDSMDLIHTDKDAHDYLRVKEKSWVCVYNSELMEEMYQEYIKKEK